MPRRAERLVRWSLAPWERKTVLGDLQEEFEELSQTQGADRARRWYWSQAIRSVWPNVLRRLNGDDERHAMFMRGIAHLGGFAVFSVVMMLSADDLSQAIVRAPYFIISGISMVLVSLFRKRIKPPSPRHAIGFVLVTAGMLIIPFGLFYPDRPWPFFLSLMAVSSVAALWPRSPAAPMTEYVVGAPSDSPADALTVLTTVVPNSPLGLSGIMLCRPKDATISDAGSVLRVWDPTIRRKFTPHESIRVCGFVNAPTDRTQASVSLIDEGGRAVRLNETPVRRDSLEQVPQTWTEVADIDPSDHFGQIDTSFSFEGIAPGSYRLRLEVSDGSWTEQREEPIQVIATT